MNVFDLAKNKVSNVFDKVKSFYPAQKQGMNFRVGEGLSPSQEASAQGTLANLTQEKNPLQETVSGIKSNLSSAYNNIIKPAASSLYEGAKNIKEDINETLKGGQDEIRKITSKVFPSYKISDLSDSERKEIFDKGQIIKDGLILRANKTPDGKTKDELSAIDFTGIGAVKSVGKNIEKSVAKNIVDPLLQEAKNKVVTLFHAPSRTGSKKSMWMDVNEGGFSQQIADDLGLEVKKYNVNLGNSLNVKNTEDAIKRLWGKEDLPLSAKDYLSGVRDDDNVIMSLDNEITKQAKKLGYDSVYFNERGHGGSEVLLLNTKNAKVINEDFSKINKEFFDKFKGKEFNFDGEKLKILNYEKGKYGIEYRPGYWTSAYGLLKYPEFKEFSSSVMSKSKQASLDVESGYSKIGPVVGITSGIAAASAASLAFSKAKSGKIKKESPLIQNKLPVSGYVDLNQLIENTYRKFKITGTKGAGLANNNPGNLIYAGQPDAVRGEKRADGTYWAVFPDLNSGYRALLKEVQATQKRGITIAQFIKKYAPSFENDTQNYTNFISNKLKAKPSDKASSVDTFELAKWIAKMDSGSNVE